MSSLVPPIRSSHRAVLGLVVIPSVTVATVMLLLYAVVLPVWPQVSHYYFPQSAATYATYRLAIYGHIVFASIALVTGPVNLYNIVRGKFTAHRRIGGVYAVAVSLAATFALFMSFHAYAGTIAGGRLIVTSGFFTLGCVWLATLFAAVRAIVVDHDPERHAFWMMVNISVTFSAVVFRVLNGAIIALGQFDHLYPLLGWVGWLPSVAVGLVLARRYRVRATDDFRPPHESTPRLLATSGGTDA